MKTTYYGYIFAKAKNYDKQKWDERVVHNECSNRYTAGEK